MPFPSVLSSFTRPSPTDRLNSPSHSALHNSVSSAVGQIEAVIGVEGPSSVVGTLEYLIKSPASSGGGHIQTAVLGGTGQTTYTKGDILVAQSPSVLTKLSIGADNLGLIADSSTAVGIKWGSVVQPDVKVTNVTSVWSKPSGISFIKVVCIGSGGSGGGGVGGNAGTDRNGGTGG